MNLNEATIKTKSGQSVPVGPGDFALAKGELNSGNLGFYPVRITTGTSAIAVIDGKGVEQSYGAGNLIGYPTQDSARAEIKATWPYHYNVLLTHPIADYMVTERIQEKIERWAFTTEEVENPKGLRGDDEMVATVNLPDDEMDEGVGVIVYRNGDVSNRFDDGTVGVPADLRELADEAEVLRDPETQVEASEWRDVEVNEDGEFVRFADKAEERRRQHRLREQEDEDEEESPPAADATVPEDDFEYEYEDEGMFYDDDDDPVSRTPADSGNYNIQTAEDSPVGTDTSDFLASTMDDIELGADPLAVFDPGEEEYHGAEGGFRPSGGSKEKPMERLSRRRRAIRMERRRNRHQIREVCNDTYLRQADQLIEACASKPGKKKKRPQKGDKMKEMRRRPRRRVSELAQQQQVRGVKTDVVTRGGETIVTYRGTPVVVFDSNQIELNTGGWKSATTKTRMNQASNQFDLGYNVVQKSGEWFVKTDDGQTIPFEGDSIIIPVAGARMGERRRPRRKLSKLEQMRMKRRATRLKEQEWEDDTALPEDPKYPLGMNTNQFLQSLTKNTELGDMALGSIPSDGSPMNLPADGVIGGYEGELGADDLEAPDDETSEISPSLPDKLGIIKNNQRSVGDDALGSVPDEESSVVKSMVQGIIAPSDRPLGDTALGSGADTGDREMSIGKDKVIAPSDKKLGADALGRGGDTGDSEMSIGKDKVISPSNKELSGPALERKRRALRKKRMEQQRRRRKQMREQDEDYSEYFELAIDGHAGIYIPQEFAQGYEDILRQKFDDEVVDCLLAGPPDSVFAQDEGCELYWEMWEEVLDNFSHEAGGHTWTIGYGEGGGDLFFIRDDTPWDEIDYF